MTQVHLIQQELDVQIQNALNITMERDAATLDVQIAREEVINMRRGLDIITAERNSPKREFAKVLRAESSSHIPKIFRGPKGLSM